MDKFKIIFLVIIIFSGCKNETKELMFLSNSVPKNIPIDFKADLIPEGKLIHKGILSPDLEEYYYTISDKDFKSFNIYVIKKKDKNWSEPESAFFNTQYNEHGMSFSPDGKTLYFSSTRPTNFEGVATTWHIWKSDVLDGKWSEPSFVDIPNLRDKLVSHPTITNSGILYFHSSNLDYSEMDVYRSKRVKDKFQNAERIKFSPTLNVNTCTPFVSPNEDYLAFATIGNQLDLMISYPDGNGGWTNTKKLNNIINDKGQGNPYITPDNKFLFFTTGNDEEKDWKVKWVNIESELKRTRWK
ncbi:TolB family protein [Croceitalea marina]|uniref:TolB family protein n=1 Tax=Croceitalea marina TaxID=1775166 RepID=A0ABW5N0W6_9FLAO